MGDSELFSTGTHVSDMRILFIADARSTISQSWISYFIQHGHRVHVISSYPCSPDAIPGATVYQAPIAFSTLSRVGHNGTVENAGAQGPIAAALASLRIGALSGVPFALRFWLGALELPRHVKGVKDLIARISPDIVHAMRIPFEGILAAKATPAEFPLLISVWGNDFTLFATRNPLIARQTRQAMHRADALHCDCRRDLNLARGPWEFQERKPAIVLPGAGGVQTSFFYAVEESDSVLREQLSILDSAPVIFNPRGFRKYVRNDVFFRAIPLVLEQQRDAVFVCSGMQANPVAQKWVRQKSIEESVRLLPVVPHEQMASLFRLAEVTVSPSLHDGTPNSLLEAMACGCFPVAGDIESVREWIVDGENGLLCDPTSPESLARAILRALKDQGLRTRAKEINSRLVLERAEYNSVMQQAEEFYGQVIQRAHSSVRV